MIRHCARRVNLKYRLRTAVCVVCLAQAVIFGGCGLRPQWQEVANDAGLNVYWVDSNAFKHLVIENSHPGRHLRIYIEGDGLPWIRERRIAVDPTPDDPYLLRLMTEDVQPAIYLGRPCYFGTATSESCRPALWTSERYGDSVVSSMCDAANRLSFERNAKTVGLIGYSGGGAIAVAMRRCVRDLSAITTIAGNLDIEAWAAYHGYAPVELPSPPESAAASGERLVETHWQCLQDKTVPPSITDKYFDRHPQARRIIVDDCEHADGWERYRPRIQALVVSGRR